MAPSAKKVVASTDHFESANGVTAAANGVTAAASGVTAATYNSKCNQLVAFGIGRRKFFTKATKKSSDGATCVIS